MTIRCFPSKIQARISRLAADLNTIAFDIDERNGMTAIDSLILSCGTYYPGRKAHEAAHLADDDVMHIGTLCKRDGIRPAWRIDAGE